MADFNINIAAEINIPYEASAEKFRRNDCVVINEDIPIGIVNNVDVPGTLFLLKEYTAANGWKWLRMYDPQYSSPSTMYFEYNTTNLTEDVDPNAVKASVDVGSVLINEAVPFFFLKLDGHTVTGNESAFIDIEIEDTTTGLLGRIRIGFYLIKEDCQVIAPPVVSEVSLLQNGCETTMEVSVKVPPEGSRYVYGVVSDGYGSISGGTLPETITASKTYTLKIDADNSGPNGIYSRIDLYVKASAATGPILGSKNISRNHTGNIC